MEHLAKNVVRTREKRKGRDIKEVEQVTEEISSLRSKRKTEMGPVLVKTKAKQKLDLGLRNYDKPHRPAWFNKYIRNGRRDEDLVGVTDVFPKGWNLARNKSKIRLP